MRVIAIAVLVLLFVGAGTALANPIIGDWLYIDFDPPNYGHEVYPAAFEAVDAYVMFSTPDFLWSGLTSVSFALEVTPGMGSSYEFTPLLPGDLAVGDWNSGITVLSTECVPTTDAPIMIGRLSFVYEGTPGYVAIVDHPDYPRWTMNCDDPAEPFSYCVCWHGGVGVPGVTGDCGVSPVEDVTWGTIKSLYR
ncbi:hypothetical protein KAW64_03995 [bacterium]|nr:hypothetical protein [bacterium]